ncbi:MAG: hypothetical protein ACREQL_03585, partial [Candidatus Binatia bacterium]
MFMAFFVAHCGGNDVRITTGGGVSPSPGTFVGVTGQGGDIAIQVGSIESIAFECNGANISKTFTPPQPVNADGTFDVTFSAGGRDFHVTGQFTDNDSAQGTIDDGDGHCDTSFDATRIGGATPTRTATPAKTPTGGVTSTPVETGTPEEMPTGATPTGGTPTPTATSTPSAACPNKIDFTGTSTGPVLDTGWTGIAHDATVVSDGTVTVDVTACAGSSRPCGVCSFTGPIANTSAAQYPAGPGGQINNHRCSGNTRKTCGTGAEDPTCASAGGTCEFYFGTLLPLSAGGVSTCVENRFNGMFTGTANIETGTSSSTPSLISRVFGGATNPHPCPRCIGDATANDGVRGGTCSGGVDNGSSCDVDGSSPNENFGSTSLDCRPNTSVLASLPINLKNSTGTEVRTLSTDNPLCRASGLPAGTLCICDTCDNLAATSCSTNADCTAVGATICGGRRCQTGANAGHACTGTGNQPICGACLAGSNMGGQCAANSACPGSTCSTGVCGVPGLATAPNACDGGPLDCASGGTPGPNDGQCQTGPTDFFCQPNGTMIGCTVDADCSGVSSCAGGANGGHACSVASECPGGSCNSETCTGSTTRECYLDNGQIGGQDTATGHAVVPVNG